MAYLQSTTVNGDLILNAATTGRGLIPVGTIIPIMTQLTGHTSPPAGSYNSYGFMKMDGTVISSKFGTSSSIPAINNNKFLLGYINNTNTGGANSATLSENQIPAHSHSTGSHNHTHNWNGYNHSHSVSRNIHWGNGVRNYGGWSVDDAVGGTYTYGSGNNGAHSHNSNGQMSHNHNVNNTGSGTSIETIPKYMTVVPAIRVQ